MLYDVVKLSGEPKALFLMRTKNNKQLYIKFLPCSQTEVIFFGCLRGIKSRSEKKTNGETSIRQLRGRIISVVCCVPMADVGWICQVLDARHLR